jgi:hypothetical protein
MLATAIVIGVIIFLGLFILRFAAGMALRVVRLILALLVIAFVVTLVLGITD